VTGRGSDDGDTRSLLDLSSALQGHGDAPAELVYFAFDLPHPDGEDKVRLPLLERKGCFSLEVLLSGAPAVIRFSGRVIGDGAHAFEAGSKLGVDIELAFGARPRRSAPAYAVGF
jgi:ATP-dependent DNA ligase